jgi:hypothetical protein
MIGNWLANALDPDGLRPEFMIGCTRMESREALIVTWLPFFRRSFDRV